MKPKQQPSPINMSVGEYESQVVKVAVQKLYQDEKTADVHFVFDSGECVPAHKYLLAAASEVFDVMFYGSIREKGNVKMGDTSAAGFVEFLQFFYFNTIKLTMGNIFDVMDFGHKYDVAECVNLCVRFLMERLTADNVLQAYGLAVLFEQKDLGQKCEHLIKHRTEDVLRSTSFQECDRKMINYLLKQDDLLCSEAELFGAIMSWVKAASKQRELTKDIVQTHLGDLFYEIRFRSMTHDEFVKLLPSFGKLFTKDESNEILQMIKSNQFQPKMFNALRRTPATPPWDKKAVVECNRHVSKFLPLETYQIPNPQTTTFSTNKRLSLGYFECAPIGTYKNHVLESLGRPIPADVTIVRVPIGNKIQSWSSEFIVVPTWRIEHKNRNTLINLSKPIVIDPKFKYEIRMKMKIPQDCVAYYSPEIQVKLRGGIIVTFHNEVNGKAKGLVYKLGFNQLNENTLNKKSKRKRF